MKTDTDQISTLLGLCNEKLVELKRQQEYAQLAHRAAQQRERDTRTDLEAVNNHIDQVETAIAALQPKK